MTPSLGGRNADAHRRSIESSARRERTDPARIAARAAKHRADAEAFRDLAAEYAARHNPERAALLHAKSEHAFQLAYDEEQS
jgi:hypothetical protein